MTKLSARISNLDGNSDDGWGVYYRARQMEWDGVDVTFLCVGDHDMAPSDVILSTMDASARAGQTGYASVQGTQELRAAIAERQNVIWEQVAVTSGGQAALFSCISAAIDPGDRVVCVDPYYATYPSTVRAAGGVFSTVPAKAENGFQPSFEDLDAACKGARALLINSPNNPTGVIYSAETMDAIRRICIKHDLWLISDEVYESQAYEGKHIRPRDLPDMAPRTLTIGSFSKSHVMTGFRIGWIVAPSNVIDAMVSLANATTYGTPEFIQAAALAGLQVDNGERVASIYRARRDAALTVIGGSNALSVSPPQGGMYLMVDVRACASSGQDFANGLLDAHKVVVMPGESFGDETAGHIRIALTLAENKLVPALEKLLTYAEGELA